MRKTSITYRVVAFSVSSVLLGATIVHSEGEADMPHTELPTYPLRNDVTNVRPINPLTSGAIGIYGPQSDTDTGMWPLT